MSHCVFKYTTGPKVGSRCQCKTKGGNKCYYHKKCMCGMMFYHCVCEETIRDGLCTYKFKVGQNSGKFCQRNAKIDGRCTDHQTCEHNAIARDSECGCKHKQPYRKCKYGCTRGGESADSPPTPIVFAGDESEDLMDDSDTEVEDTLENIMVDVMMGFI